MNREPLPRPSDPTHSSLAAAILDQKVAGIFRDKHYAYAPTSDEQTGKFRPGIAVANEDGYHPVDYSDFIFDTFEQCSEFCRGMNHHINLPDDYAVAIIASTMGGFSYRGHTLEFLALLAMLQL